MIGSTLVGDLDRVSRATAPALTRLRATGPERCAPRLLGRFTSKSESFLERKARPEGRATRICYSVLNRT
jgi:hypothetical protein